MLGFPGVSVVKNLSANVGDGDLTPGSGRASGGGHGNSLQYSRREIQPGGLQSMGLQELDMT